MAKKSLKNFNPDKVARIEMQMWRAYYKHQFIKLFFLLLKLIHEFFGLNYWRAIKTSYYAAYAAADFRLHKGSENKERIEKRLEKFYKNISKNSVESFDHEKAAKLELHWWFVDRYPKSYNTTREEALANAIANVYGVNPKKLKEYANHRAEAMVLQDKAEANGKEANWSKIESLLKISFDSLLKNIK